MKSSDYEISVCKSDMTKYLSAEVGIKIRHVASGITVESTSKKTQHLNKLAALAMLEQKLKMEFVKSRFQNIDDELIDGNTFFNNLD
jgi:protein subunit release factor A